MKCPFTTAALMIQATTPIRYTSDGEIVKLNVKHMRRHPRMIMNAYQLPPRISAEDIITDHLGP